MNSLVLPDEGAFPAALPRLLVAMLERRYLNDLRPEAWTVRPATHDNGVPLLREVAALGRPSRPEDWLHAMTGVLGACHDPGHAFVLALHGSGERNRLYLGGRRVVGAGAGCSDDFLSRQEGALKALYAGLRLGPLCRFDGEGLPEMHRLLHTSPAVALLTGIPGGRPAPDGLALDRLVRAVGTRRYLLLAVAEPLPHKAIDDALDACRRLRGEVHAYTRRTISRNEGGGESESRTTRENDSMAHAPTALSGLALLSQLVNAHPLGGLAFAGTTFANNLRQSVNGDVTVQKSTSTSWSEGATAELLDSNAEACEALLQQHAARLTAGRGAGWWRLAVYVAGENDAALNGVCGALRGLCSGEGSALDPLRRVPLPPHRLRAPMAHGQILSLVPAGDAPAGHPLGEAYDSLSSCVTSAELATLINVPCGEVPGLPVRDHCSFALTAPPPVEGAVSLGQLQDSTGRGLGEVTIPPATLNRHVFVTGMTGYGKTNTCMQLLTQAYEQLGVPFLVLEPAKAEYGRLATRPSLRGKLRVYQIGARSPLPFRLNPLAPVPGVPLGRHIDLLKAVFNASFPMAAGMPYVLEEALLDVYAQRGWGLITSENPYLSPRSTQEERAALTPRLQDLHDQIERVLERKRYGQEIHQNLGAALRSRLGSLMVGNKGLTLNTRRSTPLEDLFASPAVIQLQDLGDDEEKAFVMALLFVLLCQFAEVRRQGAPAGQRGRLRHLTLVEEAHRLLAAPRGPVSAEAGNPQARAVAMFTDMLAEMRAYGEGFLIADQVPTKLAPETLKNSSLKIVHRLSAHDDRLVSGQSMNLTEAQMRHVNNLRPGEAVVHDERIGEAVLVRAHLAKDDASDDLTDEEVRQHVRKPGDPERLALTRHGGCRSCPSPCDFFHLQGGKQPAPRPFLEAVLFGDGEEAWAAWKGWLAGWVPASEGVAYCAAVGAAHAWLTGLFTARSRGEGLAAPDRLRVEAAAAAVGELVRDWQRLGREPDEEALARLSGTREKLRLALANPPRELPGCAECPERCRMLPLVAGLDLPRLAGQLAPAFAGPGPDRVGPLRQKLQVIEQSVPLLAGARDNDELARHWRYCLVVNLDVPPAAAAGKQEALAQLRGPG